MGLFGNLFRSVKKPKRLRSLQLRVSPPNQSMDDFVRGMVEGGDDRDQALAEFLTLCVEDENVSKVMKMYGLTKSGLEEIYQDLLLQGLGQWVEGHYVALSTIAYPEPLRFYAEAQKQGKSKMEMASVLMEYWENRIPQGQLMAYL